MARGQGCEIGLKNLDFRFSENLLKPQKSKFWVLRLDFCAVYTDPHLILYVNREFCYNLCLKKQYDRENGV